MSLHGLLKVSRVLGGKKDLGGNITKLFDEATDRKSPAASLKALYGYASNTPGARADTQIRCSRAKSETCLARRSSSSEFDPCSMSQRTRSSGPFDRCVSSSRSVAWDGGESVVSETLGEPHHPMAG